MRVKVCLNNDYHVYEIGSLIGCIEEGKIVLKTINCDWDLLVFDVSPIMMTHYVNELSIYEHLDLSPHRTEFITRQDYEEQSNKSGREIQHEEELKELEELVLEEFELS